ASSCTAVGTYINSSAVLRTLIESWDGTVWSIVASPNKGASTNVLQGVSCVSASSCTAVGYYFNSSDHVRTLVESWDGTAWSIVASPNNGTTTTALHGVSSVSASSCTAVGYYINSSVVHRTLVESWDGTAWSIVASPNNGTSSNFLGGVSCVSAT